MESIGLVYTCQSDVILHESEWEWGGEGWSFVVGLPARLSLYFIRGVYPVAVHVHRSGEVVDIGLEGDTTHLAAQVSHIILVVQLAADRF